MDSNLNRDLSVDRNHLPQALDEAACAAFQASMADRIGAGEDLQADPHLATCERCTALLTELEFIVEFAKQVMPVEQEPRDDLWSQIQMAIERGEA
ncbi:hypothetical protein ACFPT7_12340 [Acidicapsa dinghuensis]|uniref:Zinc-finger domain-containing protein n=1 Tax=Acidicapsa dinghuensis TaxID=2218256 RepID=A0ABW1EGV1_9BACT|nr:hypothetical protein [Acidicapsa dinghuensis]